MNVSRETKVLQFPSQLKEGLRDYSPDGGFSGPDVINYTLIEIWHEGIGF